MKVISTPFLLATLGIIKPIKTEAQTANVTDSLALVDLYNSTNGANWLTHTGWLTGPVSTWYGIFLDKTGRVSGIVLSQDSLKGSIPASLGNLANLQTLQMAFNQLSGSIPPSLGSLSNLQSMYLDNNQLSGNIPSELGNLASMKFLELGENQLSGNIPAELGNLTSLQNELDLEGNKLTGSIPASLGNLVNLQYLDLGFNQLSGSIPAELGNLASLQILDFQYNQLSGNIPTELGNLKILQELILSNNQLSGSVPAELGNLSKLQNLILSTNQLSGSIPSALAKLSILTSLSLNANQLSDSIPSALSSLVNLKSLNLSSNQLGGNIPALLSNLVNLQSVDLSSNQLTGSIPASLSSLANLQFLNLSSNQLSDSIPSSLVNLKNLSSLYLINNYFTFDGLEAIVKKFSFTAYSPQRTVLPITNNNNTLTVSAGGTLSNNTYKWYMGATLVKTITGDSSYIPTATGKYSVAVTNTIANQLTLYSDTLAILSPQQQDSLALVDLYNNTNGPNWLNHSNWLTGPLSTWYGITLDKTERVLTINLTEDSLKGSLPASLGNLGNLQSLTLVGNKLNGSIPATLGSLANLNQLVLDNNLLSGGIPTELGNLTKLQVLSLSLNQLSGSIPAELGNLTNLIDLILNNNQLSGTVPAELSSLINLITLNLSSNKLIGSIPYSITSLGQLGSGGGLKLFYNYFTFDGMEAIVQKFGSAVTYSPQLSTLPINNTNNTLTVTAGGTLTNNTYKWYNGAALVKTITGDSSYTPTASGRYSVAVTNAIANQLTLYSDTVVVATLASQDSLALVDLYNSTNGPNWLNHANWLTGPLSTWYGITLDKTGRVLTINLTEDSLKGSLPASLGNLGNLQSLNLPWNQLNGSIPASLGGLTNLTYLNLEENQLSGSIPDSLGSLANLQSFIFYGNQLSGSIPASLGNLANLQYLNVDVNQLTGSIPASLGNLTKLLQLELYNNQLTGSIPATLGSLASLQDLALNSNQLTGSIPAELGNLTNLQQLALEKNQLSGTVPASLGNPANLEYIELYNNSLTFDGMEAVAQELKERSLVYSPQNNIPLHVASNKLSVSAGGTLSNNTYNWYNGTTLVNTTTGDSSYIPTAVGNYSVAVTNAIANQLTLYSDTVAVTTLGSQDSLALVDLYNATNGPNWLHNQGWLSAPLSTWYGITLDNNGRVTTISLNTDSLKGHLPSSLGNLTQLGYLYLNNNQISDSIPATLGSLTNLITLGLGQNQLSGGIPASLGNLANLQTLNLQSNQLSGSIPASLGSLASLQYLDLNANQLSGSIPASLGSLTSLKSLNLNLNQLSGSIPAELGSLTNVQVFNLNTNQLSGSIPSSLNNLTKLTYLGLSNNYFSFDGMEAIVQKFGSTVSYAPQLTILPIHNTSNKLSISAGGTLSNNTYKWYNGATLVKTVTGDSTYTPAISGSYYVTVTNAIATQLTLYSDTLAITANTLPVTLINFTGELTHGNAVLNWQTATEINTAYFNVQCSVDGVQFNTVGKVTAAGNSTTIQSYAFNDALAGLNPVPTQLYYRLQVADKDGAVTYSKIIELNNTIDGAITLLYPNPVHSLLNVRLNSTISKVSLTVVNTEGKPVLNQQYSNVAAGTAVTINTSTLAAGIYMLHVQYDGKSETKKFVKY